MGQKLNKGMEVFRNISVIETGPALGHGYSIDTKTLETVVTAAGSKPIPVRVDHTMALENAVGYAKNFRLKDNRVFADFTLIPGTKLAAHAKALIQKVPDMFGLSIFSIGKLETIAKQMFYRASELLAVDFVTWPAANSRGVFGNLSAKAGQGMHTCTFKPKHDIACLFGIDRAIAAEELKSGKLSQRTLNLIQIASNKSK